MIVLSHPTANQNVRQAALALQQTGLLEEFWTSINWKENSALDNLLALAPRVRDELRRRSFPTALQPHMHTFAWRELGRQIARQLHFTSLVRGQDALFSIDNVYRSLDRRVARRLAELPNCKAVYAYDDGALESFRAAKRRALKCIYEHPIVYWRKVREIQREEAELRPEWKATLLALRDSEEKLARKDEELALADVVIVASNFSRDSLAAAKNVSARIEVVRYGAPPVRPEPLRNNRADKLRVLFVGALSQAKGLGYLLEAVKRFDAHLDLTLIGQRVSADVPAQSELDRHNWVPSLVHAALLDEMARHDVLIFPSLHEGFGLVVLEAMAQGLAVMTTPHTGGPDVITDGVDGFIVPIRSADVIAEKLERFMTDRDFLTEMKRAAQRKAASWPWESYRQRLAEVAREVIAR